MSSTYSLFGEVCFTPCKLVYAPKSQHANLCLHVSSFLDFSIYTTDFEEGEHGSLLLLCFGLLLEAQQGLLLPLLLRHELGLHDQTHFNDSSCMSKTSHEAVKTCKDVVHRLCQGSLGKQICRSAVTQPANVMPDLARMQ